MNVYDTTAPPDLFCRALFDVLGVKFDANNASEVEAAAILVRKLTENAETASALADSVTLHSRAKLTEDAPLIKSVRNVSLRKIAPQASASQILRDDLPSESSSEIAVNDCVQDAESTYLNSSELGHWEGGEVLAQRHHSSYVIYSPEVLGFHAAPDKVDWSTATEDKWEKFLHLAEMKITPSLEKITRRSNFFTRTWSDLRKKIIYSAEHKAKNYGVVELKAGVGKSAAHFLFEPNSLYVVIIFNETKTLQSKLHVDDVDLFAKDIVNAFGGHEDYAKGTLESLRSVLSH